MRRVLGVLLIACLTAACGPIPKPFQSTEAEKLSNPLLDVRDGAGVTIVPLSGAPPAFTGPVTEDLVAALQAKGVPASSSGLLTNGLIIEGTVVDGPDALSLQWVLRDAGDAVVEEIAVPLGGTQLDALAVADPSLMSAAVHASAEALADILRPGSREVAPPPPATLYVAGVQGAPGDGNRSLDRAMKGALKEAQFPMVREVGETTVSLAGEVIITPLDETSEEVVILWTMIDANGSEIGTLEQQNTIPRGLLSGRWGATAYDIAQANLEGIALLLEEVDAQRSMAASKAHETH